MNSKLTLKLKKSSIDRAKKYARKNKQSLSGMVENYFNMISNNNFANDFEISPNVVELSGIINISENIKESYGKHLEEKYSK